MSIRDLLKTGQKSRVAEMVREQAGDDRQMDLAGMPAVEKLDQLPRQPLGRSVPVAHRWTLEIPGWMPARLNKIMEGRHWGPGARLKKHDREIVGAAVLAYGVPPAECRRSVAIMVVFPKGQRQGDKDAILKSLLDSLVACGALKNDSPTWEDWQKPRFCRGDELTTFITLEDVA